MSKEKTAIQKLYEDPKAKNFVNHLIRSYLPVYKPTKVWEFKDKKSYNCNVCNHTLIDLGTLMGKMMTSDEFAKDTIEDLKKGINGEEIKKEDRAIYKHISHGAILAWQGEKTTTYLCMDCIKDILDLVTTGLLMGDKNITWIVNQTRRDQVFTNFKESPILNEEEKTKVEVIKKQADKKKMTLGDLGVLQALKEKMEKEEADGLEK